MGVEKQSEICQGIQRVASHLILTCPERFNKALESVEESRELKVNNKFEERTSLVVVVIEDKMELVLRVHFRDKLEH